MLRAQRVTRSLIFINRQMPLVIMLSNGFSISPGETKKVVTIHGLSPTQKEHPELSRIYNLVDAIIVSTNYLKNRLFDCGVKAEKISIIPYGATLKPLSHKPREGIIMFAGSPLIKVKGFKYLCLLPLRTLKEDGRPLNLKLHGFYMAGHQEWAIKIAEKEKESKILLHGLPSTRKTSLSMPIRVVYFVSFPTPIIRDLSLLQWQWQMQPLW